MSRTRIDGALRLVRFAAAGAIICAAFTGMIGMDDAHQAALSAVSFGGLLFAKLVHLV